MNLFIYTYMHMIEFCRSGVLELDAILRNEKRSFRGKLRFLSSFGFISIGPQLI
jgi:hypothetical protein